MNFFNFFISTQHKHSKARLGTIKTPHGLIETPAFVFCATKASLKSIPPPLISLTGAQLLFVNTYHILANNAQDLIQKSGGIHNFMGWNKPIITDSGGFQALSLSSQTVAELKRSKNSSNKGSLVKISEEGALFSSYKTGEKILLGAELSIDAQIKIGSDFVVGMDECTNSSMTEAQTEEAMKRSYRWTKKSYEHYLENANRSQQEFYAVYQGGIHMKLRESSCQSLADMNCFGYAIGGSLGSTKEELRRTVAHTANLHATSAAKDRPLHLLGVGSLKDVIDAIKEGVDTFDCVHPTRIARHGCAILQDEKLGNNQFINLKNSKFTEDFAALDQNCECEACAEKLYSKAYFHYLLKTDPILASFLLTQHNMYCINQTMKTIREKIKNQEIL